MEPPKHLPEVDYKAEMLRIEGLVAAMPARYEMAVLKAESATLALRLEGTQDANHPLFAVYAEVQLRIHHLELRRILTEAEAPS